MLRRLWPRSLQGQLLLAVALALLLAQAIGTALVWREAAARREAALVHAAAMRIMAQDHGGGMVALPGGPPPHAGDVFAAARRIHLEDAAASPLAADDLRRPQAEALLRNILADQGYRLGDVAVTYRPIAQDSEMQRRLATRLHLVGRPMPARAQVFVAGIERLPQHSWQVLRMPVPRDGGRVLASLIGQTLLIYLVLVGAMALVLRRITRPLAALTARMRHFAGSRDPTGQLAPEGPDDVRHLIEAHNAMEGRVAGLLDEKDVMLGAIGHDLKTPLAALRVRIEAVDDEAERGKMAATIDDIARSLDDILSLARVGRPSDPVEPVELSALVAQVVEEYEDMGEPVTLASSERITLPARATWLRRALRNLIGNALRYGHTAEVSLARDGTRALITIGDHGPGIAEERIGAMLEPFTRGDPSRSSETGGAGLGLTLARAIAEQHGGTLALANRRDAAGAVTGLTATLALPLT